MTPTNKGASSESAESATADNAVTVGSLCTGYGGLDLGLELGLGVPVRHAWHLEYDKHPSAILTARFPSVTNYGDVTSTDWLTVEPIDWLTAGYPCQPFSHAGKRKGSKDERHIWPFVADAVRVLRPGRVLLENVAGHLSLGFGPVLGDLATLGYDTRWLRLRASDAGAPHRRERVFIVATDTKCERQPRRRHRVHRQAAHGAGAVLAGGVVICDPCRRQQHGLCAGCACRHPSPTPEPPLTPVPKRCPKARKKSGRKAKAPVPHAPHDWIAGVYYPAGEVDGWPARCPGYDDSDAKGVVVTRAQSEPSAASVSHDPSSGTSAQPRPTGAGAAPSANGPSSSSASTSDGT